MLSFYQVRNFKKFVVSIIAIYFLISSCSKTPGVSSNPASSNPVSSNPVSSNPVSSNPVSSNPASSNPASSNPASSNPVSSNPASSNPVSSNPAVYDVPKPTATQSYLGFWANRDKSSIIKITKNALIICNTLNNSSVSSSILEDISTSFKSNGHVFSLDEDVVGNHYISMETPLLFDSRLDDQFNLLDPNDIKQLSRIQDAALRSCVGM